MWWPAGCPLCPRVPLPLPRVVPLVALLPRERAAVGFLFAAGAEVAADVLLSALSPNLAVNAKAAPIPIKYAIE